MTMNKSYQINSVLETVYTTINTFLAHIIAFVSIIIFARFLPLSDFGLYFVLFAIATFFNEFAHGIGIGLKKRVSEFRKGKLAYIILSTVIWAGYSVLIASTFVLIELTTSVFSLTTMEIFGFVLFFTGRGFYLLFHEALSGLGKPSLAEKVRIFLHSGKLLLQGSLLVAGYGLTGILVGGAVGYFLAVLILCLNILREPIMFHSRLQSTFDDLLTFSKWSVLSRFTDSFNYQVLLIIIFLVISVDDVGIVESAMRVAAVSSIFAFSVRRALVPKISAIDDVNEPIESITTNIYKYVSLVIPPVIIGGILLGPDLLVFVYGSDFTVVTRLIFISSLVYMAVQSYRIVNDGILYGIDTPDTVFKINVLTGGLLVIILVPVAFFSKNTVLIIVSAVFIETIRVVLQYYALSEQIKIPFRKVYSTVSLQVVAATVMGVILYVMEYITSLDDVLKTPIFVGIGAVIYATLIYSFDSELKQNVHSFFSDN